jgi:hypothetical protein
VRLGRRGDDVVADVVGGRSEADAVVFMRTARRYPEPALREVGATPLLATADRPAVWDGTSLL